MLVRKTLVTVFATSLAACGGSGLDTPPECNPLDPQECMTPWPSAIYQVDDPSSPTGVRLSVPFGALPRSADGFDIDPGFLNERDGFSAAAPIITAFPTGFDPSNLVSHTDYPASVTPASPTVLVNMDTGELVVHFAEIDARVPDDPSRQALYIRPSTLLDGGTRYAVGIKKTLKAPDGSDLPIPEGFQAILDGKKTKHELLERVRPRYDAIFAALAAHGVAANDLVVAWDFTTVSRESMRVDVLAARDAAMPLMGTGGENLTFEVVEDEPSSDERIARRIDGEFDSPLFLSDGGAVLRSTRVVRGDDGLPAVQGTYRAPFTAIVPQCALESEEPVGMMIYGHGLLGASSQVASLGTRIAAGELCLVAVGTDMRGMSEADLTNVLLALNDLNLAHTVFETLIQGVINHIALVQIARGPMAQQLFVDGEGNSLVDPEKFYYYGISQGGIFGGTICAYDPFIERCVLQVGAINYSMMLERSLDWPTYRNILIGAYPDPLEVALLIGLMQHWWDLTDPASVADAMLTGDIPGAPPKQVLMQMAVADDEVPNVASEHQARTMGLPALAPSFYEPYGVPEAEGPLSSALVIYDYGLGDTIPPTNTAPPDNNVHSLVRRHEATIEMMRIFYETGEIVQTCTAERGCDCAAGGCGADL
jgi:hypothetical protein